MSYKGLDIQEASTHQVYCPEDGVDLGQPLLVVVGDDQHPVLLDGDLGADGRQVGHDGQDDGHHLDRDLDRRWHVLDSVQTEVDEQKEAAN